MSAIALIIAAVVAALAAGLYALVSDAWSWRTFAAMWLFGMVLLIAPGFIHA